MAKARWRRGLRLGFPLPVHGFDLTTGSHACSQLELETVHETGARLNGVTWLVVRPQHHRGGWLAGVCASSSSTVGAPDRTASGWAGTQAQFGGRGRRIQVQGTVWRQLAWQTGCTAPPAAKAGRRACSPAPYTVPSLEISNQHWLAAVVCWACSGLASPQRARPHIKPAGSPVSLSPAPSSLLSSPLRPLAARCASCLSSAAAFPSPCGKPSPASQAAPGRSGWLPRQLNTSADRCSGIFGYINYLVEKDRKYILDTLINGTSPRRAAHLSAAIS